MENQRCTKKWLSIYVLKLPFFTRIQHNEQPLDPSASLTLDIRLRIHIFMDFEHTIELIIVNNARMGILVGGIVSMGEVT